jgi:hypothetical protein
MFGLGIDRHSYLLRVKRKLIDAELAIRQINSKAWNIC